MRDPLKDPLRPHPAAFADRRLPESGHATTWPAVLRQPSERGNGNCPDPSNLLAARIGMKFNVALAVALGGPLLAEADAGHLEDPSLRQLMARIALSGDEGFHDWAVLVEAAYRDGSGEPEAPLGLRQVVAKFHALAGRSSAAAIVSENDLREHESLTGLIAAIAACARDFSQDHSHPSQARIA